MRRVQGILAGVCLVAASGVGDIAPPAPPPPLPAASPIAFFRQLLHTNSEGRRLALERHSTAQRGLILAKLEEYDALPRTERELRLRATEFRYYLRPLLTSPLTNRPAQLGLVPIEYREAIDQRLAQWDALPENTRGELLAYDHAVSRLARFRISNRTVSGPFPPAPPAPAATQLELQLARWQALSETQRDQLCRQFEQFLELPDPERERTLGGLSPEARERMEQTLNAFAQLPAAQRLICIQSFRRLAEMSPADRADFLRSADRWREMSPAEQEEWRRIVGQLPPLPPGFITLPPPLPSSLASPGPAYGQ